MTQQIVITALLLVAMAVAAYGGAVFAMALPAMTGLLTSAVTLLACFVLGALFIGLGFTIVEVWRRQ